MIFIKFFCLFLIITICMLLGNFKAKTYNDRVIELSNFQNSFLMLKNKIEFTYEPINNIFSEISKIIYDDDSNNVFKDVINKEDDIGKLWDEAIENLKNINLEDKEILKIFGKTLGKTDVKGQVSQIDLSIKLIEKQIEKAESEKDKNYKLYRMLGGISGAAICIILL